MDDREPLYDPFEEDIPKQTPNCGFLGRWWKTIALIVLMDAMWLGTGIGIGHALWWAPPKRVVELPSSYFERVDLLLGEMGSYLQYDDQSMSLTWGTYPTTRELTYGNSTWVDDDVVDFGNLNQTRGYNAR